METRQLFRSKFMIAAGAALASVVMLLVLLSVGTPGVMAAATTFEDDLADLTKVSDISDADKWETFAEHPFAAGHSLAGKKDTSAQYIVYEAEADKAFTAVEIILAVHASGYDLGKELKVEVLTDGATVYTPVTMEVTDALTALNDDYGVETVGNAYDLPDNVVAVKIWLLHDFAAYTLMLDKVTLTVDDAVADTLLDDDFENTDLIDDKSANFDPCWVPHGQSGLSVLGKNTGDPGYIVYDAPAGKVFSTFELSLQCFSGFDSLDDVKVEVLLDGDTDYTEIGLVKAVEFTAAGSDGFGTILVVPNGDFTCNASSVKLTLLNATPYTMMFDRVTMQIQDPVASPAPAPEVPDDGDEEDPTGGMNDLEWTSYPALPAAPSASLLFFTDNMETVDKYWNDFSGEWQAFGQNPQFEYPDDDEKYGIAKKADADGAFPAQYFTYMKGANGVGDKYIKNFELDCSLFGGTFWGDWLPTPFKEGDLKAYYRLEGSDTFVEIAVGHTDLGEANDVGLFFTTYRPMAALPDNVVEIKFELLNDWGYGIYMHEARLYQATADAEPTTQEPATTTPGDNVNTGVSSFPAALAATVLVSALLCAAVVFVSKRRALDK